MAGRGHVDWLPGASRRAHVQPCGHLGVSIVIRDNCEHLYVEPTGFWARPHTCPCLPAPFVAITLRCPQGLTLRPVNTSARFNNPQMGCMRETDGSALDWNQLPADVLTVRRLYDGLLR